MIYVALLRGINVGGNNKVEMKRLKAVFEQAGMENVSTYINSGNVFFTSNQQSKVIVPALEKAIKDEFGFAIKVLVRDLETIQKVINTLPDEWQNNDQMKCDVMFLWESIDSQKIMDKLTIKPDIDDVLYVNGALLWRVDRKNVTRSGMMKLVGTNLYAHMTIRNCNTARKLLERMLQTQSDNES